MDYHPVTQKLTGLLTQSGVVFETFEHEPVRTSEEAFKIRPGYTLAQGAKAIITRIKEAGKGKRFVMFVMPANLRLDASKVKANLGLSDLRFATEPEVAEITAGVLPGGIPPFGMLFGLDVFVDARLFENERIVFNAGDRRFSVAMPSADYRRIQNPTVNSVAS